jgi:hypothetical protein
MQKLDGMLLLKLHPLANVEVVLLRLKTRKVVEIDQDLSELIETECAFDILRLNV